jgi:hypothetical protein
MKMAWVLVFAMTSTPAFAGENCKEMAIKVVRAVEKAYSPGARAKIGLQQPGDASSSGVSGASETHVLTASVPGTEGKTVYTIELQKESCEIVNLHMISE